MTAAVRPRHRRARLRGRARGVRRDLNERGDDGGGVRGDGGRRARRRPLGRPRRCRRPDGPGASARRAVDLLGHEGRRRDRAAAARRARRARPRRARRRRSGRSSRPPARSAITVAQLRSHCGGVPGLAAAVRPRPSRARWRARSPRTGADRPGRRAVLPRVHLRLAGRRADPARRRPQRRRRSCATRSRCRSAASTCASASRRTTSSRRERRAAAARPGLPAGRVQRRRSRSAPRARLRRRAVTPDVWNDPACSRSEIPAAGGVAHRARRSRRSTAGSSAGAGLGAPRDARARPAAGRAWATTRSPAARCASGRPATSSPARRARSGPPADALRPHRRRAAPPTAAGRRCAPGFSYVTAELRSEGDDERARSLLAALHEAVAGGERAPEHPARDGRPARRRAPAGLRQRRSCTRRA